MRVLSSEEKARNKEEQENELELLKSMFDHAVSADDSGVITINVQSKYFIMVIRCLLHETYPSHDPPIFMVLDMTFPSCRHNLNAGAVQAECEQLFSRGETVIYQWVVYVGEYLESLDELVIPRESSESEESEEEGGLVADLENLKLLDEEIILNEQNYQFTRKVDLLADSSDVDAIKIHTGKILTERKSHFQAHVATVKSREEIDKVMAILLQNPKISSATHNIMAYSFRNERGGLQQDYDDDGEAKAGGRLLELINLMNVDDMVVVVTRWYGGVKLGPSRFKCINTIAKDTIVEAGLYELMGSKKKKKKK